ncbi:MAG TPA: hypothetical protein VMD99_16560 [Terriglobales bacterium]|nr:hypothetical protein [Terriglobales bacterium]
MPDPHRLKRELSEILSQPHYSALIHKQTEARQQKVTPDSIAAAVTDRIMTDCPFEGVVTVEEIKGGKYAEFYRGFDGIGGSKIKDAFPAMTLGSFWCDRALIQDIWTSTAQLSAAARKQEFFDGLRSAMFIHPNWNRLTDIACMAVPEGNWLAVVKGKGGWRSMRQQPGRPLQSPQIRNAGDVIDRLHWMPIPGAHQYYLPLFNDMWVNKVPALHLSWPLWS